MVRRRFFGCRCTWNKLTYTICMLHAYFETPDQWVLVSFFQGVFLWSYLCYTRFVTRDGPSSRSGMSPGSRPVDPLLSSSQPSCVVSSRLSRLRCLVGTLQIFDQALDALRTFRKLQSTEKNTPHLLQG